MRRWVVCSALTLAVALSVLGVWARAAVGQAQTEVTSSGVLTVKGSIVKIN